jgi:hypothetical protein
MRIYPDIEKNSSSERDRDPGDKAPITEKVAVGLAFVSVFLFFLKILFF